MYFVYFRVIIKHIKCKRYDMKRLVSFLFCIAFALTGLCSCLSTGLPTSDEKYFKFEKIVDDEGNECYSVAANEAETEYPKTLKLPTEHDGKKVIAVSSSGFKAFKDLEKLIIPYGYEKIGTDAFNGLLKLSNVTLAQAGDDEEANLTVGHSAFADCAALTEVYFGRGVKVIEAYAFKSTRVLRVELSAVVTLGDYAFMDCTALTYVFIPGTLTAGGVGLHPPFYGCNSKTEFVIDENARLSGVSVELLTQNLT